MNNWIEIPEEALVSGGGIYNMDYVHRVEDKCVAYRTNNLGPIELAPGWEFYINRLKNGHRLDVRKKGGAAKKRISRGVYK